MTIARDGRGGTHSAHAETVSFVVQLHCDGGADGSFRGRAEHLASGSEVRFTTVAGLLEFLRRLLADHADSGSATPPAR